MLNFHSLLPNLGSLPTRGIHSSIRFLLILTILMLSQVEIQAQPGPYIPGTCITQHNPATWTQLAANDDGSTGVINLPFTFTFYGTSYTQCYVNNNGNITFNSAYGAFTSSGFPIGTPMIAPFWADIDTRNGQGEVWYLVTADALYVSWLNVGPYDAFNAALNNLENTFQLVITNGSSTALSPGNNIGFFYGDMEWTTGDASGGSGGVGGSPATVGTNAGDGINYLQVGQFDQTGTNYDGGNGGYDGVDYLDNGCQEVAAGSSGNFPPSLTGLSDTDISICQGSSVTLDFGFIGPENNQNVNVTSIVAGGGYGGLTVNTNTAGNPSTQNITLNGNTPGNYTVTLTAVDNYPGTPGTTTSVLN
ncbi:MAG: nidogen-like domain-containing protein, partial [Flavobacteriales bacterium]